MVGQLSSLRARQMLKLPRLAAALCASALFGASPAQAQYEEPGLGALVLAALGDVCVPVIERGDALSETASKAGFLEVTGENRDALGGSAGTSWWMYEFAQAVLVVGRDLEEPGSACQIAASVPAARIGTIEQEVDRWASQSTPAFRQIASPSSAKARDAVWMWERSAGGGVQRLRLSLTRHNDGTASSTLVYGLFSQPSR